MERAVSNDIITYFTNKVMEEARRHYLMFGEHMTKGYMNSRIRFLIAEANANGALELQYGIRDERTGEKIELVCFGKIPEDYDEFVDI